jgi:hypothetical protein
VLEAPHRLLIRQAWGPWSTEAASGGGDRQATVQLHLPDDAGRRALDRGRDHPGRRLGRLFLGPVQGWDAKEVWALITLLVYLIPLHGRFAGWVNTFGLVFASVFCFLSVVMAWYGVIFVLGVGLHSYGFVEGGSQGALSVILAGILAFPVGVAWRRRLGCRPMFPEPTISVGETETLG